MGTLALSYPLQGCTLHLSPKQQQTAVRASTLQLSCLHLILQTGLLLYEAFIRTKHASQDNLYPFKLVKYSI